MSPKRFGAQFWDSSALVALIFKEPHSEATLKAVEEANRFFAWEWIQVEAHAALSRRGAKPEQLKTLASLLESFQYLTTSSEDHPAIIKIAEKHKLRAADAGHLFCLKQVKKVVPGIVFVCFDGDLMEAADREAIHVFSPTA